MKPWPESLQGVLFDLDGTLVDSAADLYSALHALCQERGVPTPAYEVVRAVVSHGAQAVARCAWPDIDEAGLRALIPDFLRLYQATLAEQTRPFEGVEALLAAIEAQGWTWGIVTNKAGFLTDDLVQRLGWAQRAAVVVAGDTLPVKKPDPAPVLLACRRAGIDPAHGLFVGDDLRDVQAGHAAGMYTVAAAWGYLAGGDPRQWQADLVLDHPLELLARLRRQAAA